MSDGGIIIGMSLAFLESMTFGSELDDIPTASGETSDGGGFHGCFKARREIGGFIIGSSGWVMQDHRLSLLQSSCIAFSRTPPTQGSTYILTNPGLSNFHTRPTSAPPSAGLDGPRNEA